MTQHAATLVFGPFRLIPSQRILLRGGRPVRLPSRAWEILKILTQRAGELVSKRELMQRVWSGLLVEEGTLRVHVATLRKILEDGKEGIRYVESVTGLGYRFVAPVSEVTEEPRAAAPRIVGREETINLIAGWLTHRPLVTIAGPGGAGKTTVAVAAAQSLRPVAFPNIVTVDLAQATGPGELSTLAAHLGKQRTLIVLDGCEHLIQPVANLLDKLRSLAPGVHFLVTSREPLRVKDEWVFRLPPLDVPPPNATLRASEALRFSAMSLFTLQAMESRNAFELRDSDVAVVAEICRRLDGNPLAIELAADCMDALPLRTLLAQLDDVLTLRTRGRRTAAPRHRSLRALLDWSHETLSPMEQVAWRRLAVIAGSFDLESAQAVLVGEGIDAGDVLDVMTELAAKSLLTTRVSGAQALFTLPYMSRAYALEKLESSEDSSAVRLRYAQLCGQWYRTPLIVQSD